MEISVWQSLVQAAISILSQLRSSRSQSDPASGGASQSAQGNAAGATLTSSSALILTVTRGREMNNGVFGRLTTEGFECFTLENQELSIPAGSYQVSSYQSPRFGQRVPILLDVPGRSEIEIHKGNYPSDSRGCIIVAAHCTGGTVEWSEKAFTPLCELIFAALDGGKKVQIDIRSLIA